MTKEEFGNICEKSKGELIRLARRFIKATGGPEEAEDIVQEATIVLWQLYERNYPIQNPKALAIRITKNICVSLYRKRRLETIPLEGLPIIGDERADERVENSDNQIVKKHLYDHLSVSERDFMAMRNDQDLSLDEIARKTGRSKASIKVTLSNARRKLRENMREK